MFEIKEIVRRIPVVGQALQRAKRQIQRPVPFVHSTQYWENRYRSGGNSGPGSYNRLSTFKAQVLNQFVAETGAESVCEFGCGDGAQLELAEYPKYFGYDVSSSAVELCRLRFSTDPTKIFDVLNQNPIPTRADVTLSLDVIFHLVEDDVFERYMEQLFDCSNRHVVIYSSDYESRDAPHVRHHKFTEWVAANRPNFSLMQFIPNPYTFDPMLPTNTSVADFYIYEKAGTR